MFTILVFALYSYSGLATVTFIDPTPSDATLSSNTSVIINVSITESNLSSITHVWNGTNFTFYNSSLVLLLNFEPYRGMNDSSSSALSPSIFGDSSINSSGGKYGASLTLDGTGDYLTIPRVITDDFTLAAWINKRTSLTNNGACSNDQWYCGFGILDAEVAGVSNDFGLGVKDNKIIFGIGNADTSILSTTTLNSDQWYFVAATREKSTGAMRIYVNGINETQATGNTNSLTSNANIYIGEDGSGNRGFFNGQFDDVQIYNRTLSNAEIAELYLQNIWRHNATQWYFYVNQSQNATTVLSNGTYTYQIFTTNTTGSGSNTEQRTYTLGQLPTAPEFGEWAILLILISTVAGYFHMRTKQQND